VATILIVDDEPVNRFLIRATLVNHNVVDAGDSDEAIAMVDAHRPDLIILDLSLGRESGFDVLRQLRKRGCASQVLLYTATAPDASMKELADLYDARGFLPKPGEPQEVIALVEATLAG